MRSLLTLPRKVLCLPSPPGTYRLMQTRSINDSGYASEGQQRSLCKSPPPFRITCPTRHHNVHPHSETLSLHRIRGPLPNRDGKTVFGTAGKARLSHGTSSTVRSETTTETRRRFFGMGKAKPSHCAKSLVRHSRDGKNGLLGAVPPGADGPVLRLGPGDVARISGRVLLAASQKLHAEFELRCEAVSLDRPVRLPVNVVPMSPIVDLHPQSQDFGRERVLLVLPACTGAEKAWCSMPDGSWEVSNVRFCSGYGVLCLEHFCLL